MVAPQLTTAEGYFGNYDQYYSRNFYDPQRNPLQGVAMELPTGGMAQDYHAWMQGVPPSRPRGDQGQVTSGFLSGVGGGTSGFLSGMVGGQGQGTSGFLSGAGGSATRGAGNFGPQLAGGMRGGTVGSQYQGPPTAQQTRDFLPDILRDPYVNAINNAQTMANWAGMAVPGAAAFHADLYNPGMSAMEQAYAGSSAALGSRELAKTHNRIAGMFENSASHGSLAPAFLDATNQFNAQMNQMIGQMGTQRQQTAAQMTPFTMGFPIQAGQAGQAGAQGLYDMAQNAMYGDLNFPLAMFGSNPFMAPTVVTS